MDIVFTIVSRNYAALAASLMESLAAAEPDSRRVVIASDGPIPQLAGKADLLEPDALDAPFQAMRLYYDALELNTALKPYAFRKLLAEPGVRSVTYMDPDIWVYRPLSEVHDGLAKASLCLIPHLTRPLPGSAEPNDRTILQSGSYNLGFMAARSDPEIAALVDWWAEKCRLECRVDFAGGLFTDQRWMDLAPGFVSAFERLRQPTLNLAYWNLHGRTLERAGTEWRVDGQPLGFFHFSGFDPDRPDVLSKHQNRTQVADGSPLSKLLAEYAGRLKRNGHDSARQIPYAHDRFDSGRPVTRAMRRRALRAVELAEPPPEGLGPDAEAWLDAADPGVAAEGLPDVTRLMDQLWRDDPAAAGFDRATIEGRLAFHAWFAESGADERARQAAARLQREAGESRRPADPPWRAAPWQGSSASIGEWLREPPAEGPPRASAALLAARADLRRRFADDAEGLLLWCIGVEAAAGRFDAGLLPADLVSDLAARPEALRRAGRLAAPARLGTPLARELFTAFTLAHKARWPDAWRQPLQRGFSEPDKTLPTPFLAFMRTIWASRADLQKLFPLKSWRQRFAYLRWLVGGGLAEYGVDPAALPAKVRNHPQVRLALRTVRSAPEPEIVATGACGLLVVVDDDRPLSGLPGEALVYRSDRGVFHTAGGAERPPPARVATAAFAVDPEMVAADAIALLARGVEWREAVGVWNAAAVARLSESQPALGFVDRIETDAAASGLFRPSGPLSPSLARLIAP